MNNTITITFPDGNTKNVNKSISGFEIAESISKSLAICEEFYIIDLNFV